MTINLPITQNSDSFPKSRILNGRKLDLRRTKLFEGPFPNAEEGSECLAMTRKGIKRALNLRTLTITK